MSKAGQEQVITADAYVAALDVPGAKKLIPQVPRCRWRGSRVGGRLAGGLAAAMVGGRLAGRASPQPATAGVPLSLRSPSVCPPPPPSPPCLLLPKQAWRGQRFFDDVFKLVGVPVITVQLRYDGWVTEMQARALGCSLGCLPAACWPTAARWRPAWCWRQARGAGSAPLPTPPTSLSCDTLPTRHPPATAGPVEDEGPVGRRARPEQPAVQVRAGGVAARHCTAEHSTGMRCTAGACAAPPVRVPPSTTRCRPPAHSRLPRRAHPPHPPLPPALLQR